MLPEYVIYEELKRLRQLEERGEKLAQLEIPLHIPFWPEQDEKKEDEKKDRNKNQVDIVIINM